MDNSRPTCYIVAGPNGAGKTTFALKYLQAIANCPNFINVDEIAHGLSPLDVEAAQFRAGKLFLELLEDKIAKRENFSFETTLAGKGYITKIRRWHRENWNVVLYYLYLPSAEVSASRVQARVEAGGHNVPLDAIARRYSRSIENLFLYAEVCDMTLCFDNSNRLAVPIFEKTLGGGYKIFNQSLFDKIRGASFICGK